MIFAWKSTQNCLKFNKNQFFRHVSYVQGQLHDNKIREYFYYIDHNGMLFLDDAKMKNFTSCFKETKFLQFFFHRLRINDTGRYQNDFPYLSICGRERNYIRCDDLPIVYTHVLPAGDDERQMLSYAHAGDKLTFPFEPDKIFMSPTSGRVYHPTNINGSPSIGLIRSKLAIEFSKYFEFESGDDQSPTHFTWKGVRYNLNRNWMSTIPIARQ